MARKQSRGVLPRWIWMGVLGLMLSTTVCVQAQYYGGVPQQPMRSYGGGYQNLPPYNNSYNNTPYNNSYNAPPYNNSYGSGGYNAPPQSYGNNNGDYGNGYSQPQGYGMPQQRYGGNPGYYNGRPQQQYNNTQPNTTNGPPPQYNTSAPPYQSQYAPSNADNSPSDANDSQYATLADQAMKAYQKGQANEAIDLMSQAYKLAPDNPYVLNNYSASYVLRAVHREKTKDTAGALSDYRQAEFLLEYAWPESTPVSSAAKENIHIIQENINGVMTSLHYPIKDAAWHLKAATDLRGKGNLPEAMVEYGRVTDLTPKNAPAWTGQGDILTVRHLPEKAAEAYQHAIDASSNPSDGLFVKLANTEMQLKKPDKAADAFNKALNVNAKNQDALLGLEQIWKDQIAFNPRNVSAHVNLGAVYQQMGRLNDAHGQYVIADQLSPNNPIVKENLANLLAMQGNTTGAAQYSDALLRQNPSDLQAWLVKADALKAQNNPQAEIQTLQAALQHVNDRKAVYDRLVDAYKSTGDTVGLAATWSAYAAAYPQDAVVQYDAGLNAHDAKDYPTAISYYRNAIAIDPTMAEAYANLGTALHAVNQDPEALSMLKKAITLKPDLPDVKNLIGAIETGVSTQATSQADSLYQQGKYTEAAQLYENALQQSPDNADLYARYGLALQAQKHFPDAIKAYDKAIALDPNNAQTYYYKGTLYDAQNNTTEAAANYKKALAIQPGLTQAGDALKSLEATSSDAQLNSALAAYNKKNYAQALQLVGEVLRSDPKNATAFYYQGLVYDAQKKPEAARLAYQKAIGLNPQQTDALYALAVDEDTQGLHIQAKKTYQAFLTQTQGQPEDDFIKYAKARVAALK